jgi:pimeloyl-ACP methyl ester carboxylesterase
MGGVTAVFVHGVPETPAVWHGLLAALDRPDAVTLSLPGFDSARPAGFGATMDEYAAWLTAELERLGDPVDLVGHDWGGGFVVRVVSTRPELVRSWVTDAASIGDVEFEWHDFAKIWQTPQAGEDFWNQQLATPAEERAGVFQMFGCPRSRPLTWHRTSTALWLIASSTCTVRPWTSGRSGARISRPSRPPDW